MSKDTSELIKFFPINLCCQPIFSYISSLIIVPNAPFSQSLSHICLKTTHRLHNTKNRNCPAQIIITILAPHQRHQGYLIEAMLQHTHNHAINVADALRFRPISDKTKSKYYDLFKQGHSPSCAHLEYETNLMYQHDPQLLADRNINPKTSDVYNLFNKWRKNNLGVRTGKET